VSHDELTIYEGGGGGQRTLSAGYVERFERGEFYLDS